MSAEFPPSSPAHWPSAEDLYVELREQVRQWLQACPDAKLVGVRSGGGWLVERLQIDLGIAEAAFLNISFYRDDFDRIGLHPRVTPTQMPFAVNDAHLLLIDDVLYTGRTVRAALNELFDYGRPASVKLAVLVDRDGRELPFAADFAGWKVALGADARVLLRQQGSGFALQLRERVGQTHGGQ